jgi:hypothetical protein
MKKSWRIALLAIALAAAARAADILSVAEVEKAAGVSGVKLAPRDPAKGAGGDLNFSGPDGKLLVMVRLYKSSRYAALKKMYFAADVPGVGDEAFAGPPGVKQPYVVYFRKGEKAASVTTYFDRGGKPKLTLAQLSDLGRTVASRI